MSRDLVFLDKLGDIRSSTVLPQFDGYNLIRALRIFPAIEGDLLAVVSVSRLAEVPAGNGAHLSGLDLPEAECRPFFRPDLIAFENEKPGIRSEASKSILAFYFKVHVGLLLQCFHIP